MSAKQVSRGPRVYEGVVEKLKASISSGELQPGEPLPSERRLMDDFGVSRSSLREAFRVLELLGLIESIPGKGRFVRRPAVTGEGDIPLEDSALLELVEARRILEPEFAAEAARKATSTDLTAILRILSDTEAHVDQREARAQYDVAFHLALAEATHNFIFVSVTRRNFELIMATHDRIYNLLDDLDAFLLEHRAIYEAILLHDPAAARQAAAEHMDRIYRTLLKGIAARS
ncbi:MAG: FadR family transcriptional regulator [Firmicutes bacterium]|nr:FadR family transcriptional regulator [Bacillota bacterium]